MSNIKSKYFDFINSDDYSSYYLEGTQEDQLKASKTMQERFSKSSEYVDGKDMVKRLKQRFNRFSNSNK